MQKFLKKLGNIFLLAVLAFSLVGGFLYSGHLASRSAEASFYPVQTKATRLYTGIANTTTSARLRSFYDLSGSTKLTMAMFGTVGYVTFDPGTTKEEAASFTGITDNGDGTQTLTGLTRGLLGRYPYGTGGTAYSHDANSYVVVSNSADFYSKFSIKSNDEAITGLWNFNAYLPTSSILATTSNQFVNKAYADGLAFAGVATSTETSFGGVWLATALQQASSTNGSPNAPRVLQSRYATSSPNGTLASLYTLILNNAGKIAQSAFDFSQNTTWTGAHTFNTATTTFNAPVVVNSTTTFSGFTSSATFGGRGTDGVLNVTSGTTTIDAGGSALLIKEYTSISVTGTGHIAFSNPNSAGTIIYLKSQGDITLTCSIAPCISTEGMGAAGGAGATADCDACTGNAGTSVGGVFESAAGHGGGGGPAPSGAKAGGTGGTTLGNSWEYTVSTQQLLTRSIKIVAGSGGGGGSSGYTQGLVSGVAGGAGGKGGGALMLEVGGYLNLTTTGAILTRGSVGESITTTVSDVGSNKAAPAGGAGGSAGMVVILYNGLTANSGTIVSTGGAGGAGGGCTDIAGGAGGNTADSGNGGAGAGSYGSAGANGGAGATNGASGNGVAGSSGSSGSGGGGGGGATCAYNLSSSQSGGAGGAGGSTLTALVAKNYFF